MYMDRYTAYIENEMRPVDEVERVALQLFGRVQVGEHQHLAHVLYREILTQRLFTHHLQPFQRVLK